MTSTTTVFWSEANVAGGNGTWTLDASSRGTAYLAELMTYDHGRTMPPSRLEFASIQGQVDADRYAQMTVIDKLIAAMTMRRTRGDGRRSTRESSQHGSTPSAST